MSREFGQCSSGYFHTQMTHAAEDLEQGHDELSRRWAKFFRAFETVAYAIASSEASDSCESDPIRETIKALPELKQAIADVEQYVQVFDRVAREAIREYLKEKQEI